jgi:pimeloyl-ACP methyl ester carboxylesterase
LLTLLWHGDPEAENVVLMMGGAMGGLLGPSDGLYPDLGERFAAQGIGTIRIGYRKPNHLPRCVHDVCAAADLASRSGAARFVTVGHSFGGAVAVQAGTVLAEHCSGVVTLSTQSAGCEEAEHLQAPLLLVHGMLDELLPAHTSELVKMIAGQGELMILPEDGHLLDKSRPEILAKLCDWIPIRLDTAG